MKASGLAPTLAVIPRWRKVTLGTANLSVAEIIRQELGNRVVVFIPCLRYASLELSPQWGEVANRKSLDLMSTHPLSWELRLRLVHREAAANRAYHEGSDPGFGAFEIRYPTEQAFIVVFANVEDAPVRVIANGLPELLLLGSYQPI